MRVVADSEPSFRNPDLLHQLDGSLRRLFP